MPITYRSEKGSPLTSSEIDGNFRDLDARLNALTDKSEAGEGIGKIQVGEEQMKITGTFGTDFGTFPLPKAQLKPCGPWTVQTPYNKLDLVTMENALYCCRYEHTSTTWIQDSSFWQEVIRLPLLPPHSLAFYEKASVPERETMGKLAVLVEETNSTLIFFNGNQWQRLMKGEIL